MTSNPQRSVLIKGEEFKFSCAHFVSYNTFRERLHGHNYTVEVEMSGPMSLEDGYVIDFGVLKRTMRSICKALNERVIVPLRSDTMQISYKDAPGHTDSLESQFVSCGTNETCDESNPEDLGQVEIRCQKSFFSFPKSDCALLPIRFSTAEEISGYFTSELKRILEHDIQTRQITSLTVRVFERPTQAASYTVKCC